MRYTHAELRSLVARATPLPERWSGAVETESVDREGLEARLQRWRDSLSSEKDDELLRRRLADEGIVPEACGRWLGTVRLADEQPLPAWAERLDGLLTQAAAESAFAERLLAMSCDGTARRAPPFARVFVHFVAAASDELRQRAGPALRRLSDAAQLRLQKALLRQLCGLSSLALGLEFQRYVALRDPIALFREQAADAEAQGERFVDELLGGGLFDFLQKYAVLGRLLAVAVEHWVEHVAEFCVRLDHDLYALTKHFGAGQDLGEVSQVECGLSDPHGRGRSVISLVFASGIKLVYKPRDLGIDVAFFALVDWLNAQSASADDLGPERGSLPLRSLKVLNRTTHGWMEFVEHAPLPDADAARRYYRRVGMMLSLIHALDGVDFHLANVIASGEEPVVVDLETLLHAVPRPWDSEMADSAELQALGLIEGSVLRSSLLPSSLPGGPSKSLDLSGFGGDGHQDLETMPVANVPTLFGEPVLAREYLSEITDGFAAMYRCLMARRDELLAPGGPLDACRGLVLRHVLRATNTYGAILGRCLHPEFLHDGADRSIELERLGLAFVSVRHDASNPLPWGVLRAELEAMERLDFPKFHVPSDGTDLLADARCVAAGVFEQSGFERVRARIQGLCNVDLSRQLGFIQAAFHARWMRRVETKLTEPVPGAAPLTSADLIASATRLAEQIRSSALRGRDGSATWVSLSADVRSERLQLVPMGHELYDGRLGVVLFLAALEHISGGAGFRDLALAALLPLRNALRRPAAALAPRGALGGAAGQGSQLYGLVRVATWLQEADLLELASTLADCLVRQRIARDEALDVVGGAAGGILGLLALARAVAHGPVEQAVRCGDHLLAKRVANGTGLRAWRVPWAARPLTGFAHGAAGIAYALTLLGHASGEQRFIDAAEEGIAYEDAVWSAEVGNWPDYRALRADGAPAFMNAWCHGAAGIGLGRLGGLGTLDAPGIRKDIERALDAVLATSLHDVDHVCCGNFGRLDLMLEAGQRLRRPELLEQARKRASAIVRRAQVDGHFLLHAQAPGVGASPSLFQGLAGIGYQLLRLAKPDRLPCILLWQ